HCNLPECSSKIPKLAMELANPKLIQMAKIIAPTKALNCFRLSLLILNKYQRTPGTIKNAVNLLANESPRTKPTRTTHFQFNLSGVNAKSIITAVTVVMEPTSIVAKWA